MGSAIRCQVKDQDISLRLWTRRPSTRPFRRIRLGELQTLRQLYEVAREALLFPSSRSTAKKIIVLLTDGTSSACSGVDDLSGNSISYVLYWQRSSGGCKVRKGGKGRGVDCYCCWGQCEPWKLGRAVHQGSLVSTPSDEHYIDIGNIAHVQGKAR